jgi:hypothetical protein
LPSWFAAPSVYDTTDDTAYFVNFQRINDYYKIEIADTETAIATSSLDATVNLETDVTWAGSASLAVPAAIVLAALVAL